MASIASQSTDFKDFDLNSLTEVECKKLVKNSKCFGEKFVN